VQAADVGSRRRTHSDSSGGINVSIVRIGLGETKHFAEGYEAIFGKKTAEQSPAKTRAEKAPAKKKKEKRKKK
jgi:hypothetical protein